MLIFKDSNEFLYKGLSIKLYVFSICVKRKKRWVGGLKKWLTQIEMGNNCIFYFSMRWLSVIFQAAGKMLRASDMLSAN